MARAQEVEMLRRQLDELTARMEEVRQQSSNTAMNAALTGLTEAVRTMGQSVSKPRPEDMRVGKSEPYAPGKDFDDWDFTFDGYAGSLAGLFVQIMTYKFGSKIEDVEDRLNEFLELVRRYDDANGTNPVPDQVKKACIISNTPEPLKTHLRLNVAELGNFNASRVATEDHLRSKRIFRTTSAGNIHDEDPMEVDAISRKGQSKGKSGKGKKGGKKGKQSHSGKGHGEEHSRFEGECRNCGKHGHKAADCWYNQPPKPQGKGKGSKKSKSKVTDISSSKQVEDTCTAFKFVSSKHDWMRR